MLSLTPTTFPSPENGVPYAPKIREWPYLCNRWSDPLHVWFYSRVFGDGGSNSAISGSNTSRMAAAAILEIFQMAISPQPVVRSTSCLVICGVFGDGRSNGAIFDSNKFKMAAAAILDNFEWLNLRNWSTYSPHRAVIFAIAQLSCYNSNFMCILTACGGLLKLDDCGRHNKSVLFWETIYSTLNTDFTIINISAGMCLRYKYLDTYVRYILWYASSICIKDTN